MNRNGMTRQGFMAALASAWSEGRGETYDSLLAARHALRPVADEIVAMHMDLQPGHVSEGATINIQIPVRTAREILAAALDY